MRRRRRRRRRRKRMRRMRRMRRTRRMKRQIYALIQGAAAHGEHDQVVPRGEGLRAGHLEKM
eukprot:3868260-Pyramimonas_sp.AAC.1